MAPPDVTTTSSEDIDETTVLNGKMAAGWRVISNGYGKLWYLKSTLRWMIVVAVIADLSIFGAAWVNAEQNTGRDYSVVSPFPIVAPLFSLVVDIIAIIQLFLLRRGVFPSPFWILSGDILVGVLLIADLILSAFVNNYYWFQRGDNWTAERILEVPWGFSIAALILHTSTALIGIFETHIYRRVTRETRINRGTVQELKDFGDAKDEPLAPTQNIASRSSSDQAEEMPDSQRIELASSSAQKLEAADTPLRVELPDGRVVELPEGCRVELPAAGHRAELPGTTSKFSTAGCVELESPASTFVAKDRAEDRFSFEKV